MKNYMKFLLPLILVGGALAVVAVLFFTRPQAQRHPLVINEPLVSVTAVTSQDLKIPVFTRGTVTPGTEIPLVSEVSGPVTFVSENFARGGFFRKGEVLIRVDPVEYEVTRKKADAAVAQALQLVKQAEAEKRVRSAVSSVTSELGRFEYQYQQAKAQYDAARAELDAVNLQKRKTVIVAPFDGRVRMGSVNPGQYLRPGMQLGLIYAVNAAEVRLPLSDTQLALVDVPFRFGTEGDSGPNVTLVGDYGGRKYYWQGQVVRAESGVDEFNRLLYVIAQIPDPYAIDVAQPDRPPLTAGNFVEAQIEGRSFAGLFVVPRAALRHGAQVWTVNEENRLQRKPVDILYKGKDVVYIKSGLADGDKVVLSQLDIAVEGMKVRSSEVPAQQDSEGRMRDNLLHGNKPAAVPAETPAAAKAITTDDLPDAVKEKVEEVKQRWDDASVAEKAAAVAKAREVVREAADKAKEAAVAPSQAQQVSPLADLINNTEQQMKQAAPQAASASAPTGTVAAPAVKSAPAAAAPTHVIPSEPAPTQAAMPQAEPAQAVPEPSTTPKGYVTIPVSAPKVIMEAAQ